MEGRGGGRREGRERQAKRHHGTFAIKDSLMLRVSGTIWPRVAATQRYNAGTIQTYSLHNNHASPIPMSADKLHFLSKQTACELFPGICQVSIRRRRKKKTKGKRKLSWNVFSPSPFLSPFQLGAEDSMLKPSSLQKEESSGWMPDGKSSSVFPPPPPPPDN